MNKIKSWRILPLLLVLLLLFQALSPSVLAETPAEKYQRLKEELANINAQITQYQDSKTEAMKLKKALQEQKFVLDEMIAIKQQEIEQTQGLLDAKQAEVAEKRTVIYENDLLFQQRLVAIYKQNDSGVLSSILHVDSYTEFLAVADSLRRISIHDTDLLKLLNKQREELEAQQLEIDALLATLHAAHDELAENARILAENISAQDAKISAADAQIKAQKETYNDTYTDLVAAQREMNAIGGNLGGSSSGDGSQYVGGQFGWPVPGFYNISCYFGSPDPNGAPHRGLDVAGGGILGAKIAAAGKGTVIVAGFAGSYGNYVVIDHGAGVKTLYAHCSALWVSVGTSVERGDGIGAVGTTGFVTGPHLHFEVSVNNVLQNPLSYLK